MAPGKTSGAFSWAERVEMRGAANRRRERDRPLEENVFFIPKFECRGDGSKATICDLVMNAMV